MRGHPVLGAIPDIGRVYRETAFNEILIAQDQTEDADLKTLQSFATDHEVTIHRYLARFDPLTSQPPGNGQTLNAESRRFA